MTHKEQKDVQTHNWNVLFKVLSICRFSRPIITMWSLFFFFLFSFFCINQPTLSPTRALFCCYGEMLLVSHCSVSVIAFQWYWEHWAQRSVHISIYLFRYFYQIHVSTTLLKVRFQHKGSSILLSITVNNKQMNKSKCLQYKCTNTDFHFLVWNTHILVILCCILSFYMFC